MPSLDYYEDATIKQVRDTIATMKRRIEKRGDGPRGDDYRRYLAEAEDKLRQYEETGRFQGMRDVEWD